MRLVNWWQKITGRKPIETVVEHDPALEVSLICGQLVEILGPSPSLIGETGRIIHDFKSGDLFEVYIPKFSSSYLLTRKNLKPLEVSLL